MEKGRDFAPLRDASHNRDMWNRSERFRCPNLTEPPQLLILDCWCSPADKRGEPAVFSSVALTANGT